MPAAANSLLLVDDDEILRRRLARAMLARGYTTHEVATGRAAIELSGARPFHHALVDLRLPDTSGLEVVRGIKAVSPHTRVVVLTGYGSIATALEAVRLGAADYLSKPVDADEVERALERDGDRSEPINRVLADCDGNVTTAARVLGIHRRSLQRKLAKFPLAR
jgi:two-component system response regulator RegA